MGSRVGADVMAGTGFGDIVRLSGQLQAAHEGLVMLLDPHSDVIIESGGLVSSITDGVGNTTWAQAGGARPTLGVGTWGDGSNCLEMTASTYLRNAYAQGGATMNPGSNTWLFILAFSAPAAVGWKIAAGNGSGSADGMRLYTTPSGAIATYNGAQPMSQAGLGGLVVNASEQVVGWGVSRPDDQAIKLSSNVAEASRYPLSGTNPASIQDTGLDFNIWGRADGASDYGTGKLRLAAMFKRDDAVALSMSEAADILGLIKDDIGVA